MIFTIRKMKTNIIRPREKDNQIIQNNLNLQNEDHEYISYKNKVCIKPWGHEFLAYQSKKIGIWCLTLNEGHKTSLHCHFKKDTWIVVLKGCAKIETLQGTYILHPLDSILISKCTFHALGTFASSTTILEIEVFQELVSFSDKNDLLRIDDTYKRKPVGYESSVQIQTESLEQYGYFYIDNNTNIDMQNMKVESYLIKDKEEFNKIPECQRIFLIEGSIRSGNMYLKEGTLIDKNILHEIFIDQPIQLLCLSKIDWQEDQKIIYSMEHLKEVVYQLKSNKESIILTSGCYDILHVGHLHTLKQAKTLGSKLLVCLSSDEQIKALKGNSRPINNNEDRISLFKTIQYVDYIIPYKEKHIENEEMLGDIMKLVDPDVWVKGSDYTKEKILEKHPYLRKICLIDLVEEKSTTNIIRKILNT